MGESKTILLVEDEALIAFHEMTMLHSAGYAVVQVCSGEDAIAKVKSASPEIDLILMDVNLGRGMDGTQAAQEILKERDIPIIFLSSHTEPEVVEKTEKITSYGYVVKNTGNTVLLASIRMAFRLHTAHEALRYNNEKLRLSQEASRAGTWDWDIVHETFDWSPELLKVFGVDANVTVDLEFLMEHVHPEDRETLAKNIQDVLGLKIEKFNDFRIILPNQEIRWIRATGKTYYEGDRAVRMTGLCMDITERKQAEKALAHSHDLMRYIIEHNRSAVAVHDRDMKYIYVSQRYLDDYKIKDQDIIGKHHYDVFPDLPQKWRDVHQKALAGEVSSAEDDPYVREDGSVDWTRWECRPWYEADGSIGGIIVYTEVVTDRKRTEEALRRSLREKEVLMHELQHRVKNSLMVAASLLSLEEDNLPDERTRAIFANTRSRLHSMSAVYELLNRTGGVDQIDLRQYIQNLVEALSQSYTLKTGLLTIEAGLEAVQVDLRRAMPLGIILNELIINALKHAFPVGRTLADRSLAIRVQLDQSGEQVSLCVIDNGVGLPDKISCSGMGLELVQILTRQIDGRFSLGCSSESGCIACVTFHLK
jgi:two-component system, sensor histidine kinase PdtaS